MKKSGVRIVCAILSAVMSIQTMSAITNAQPKVYKKLKRFG